MKRLLSFRAIAVALLAGVLAGPTFANQETSPPALLLSVSVPPMWDSLHETDIADSFHQRILSKLHQAGFVGEIGEFDRFDQPAPDIPVMEINLMQWRPERTGSIVCTFAANLKIGGKNENLGLFTGTAPQWMTTASHTWELRRGLDDSANRAIESLVKKLRAGQFLPPAKKNL